jgi:hypothetical protein
MAASQPENRLVGSVIRLWSSSMFSVILCVCSGVCAQAQDAHTNNTNESWTTTTQASVDNTGPTRTTECG